MEVATTNNHNQTHHHHHQHQHQQHHTHLVPHHSISSSSAAAGSNSGGKRSPFQREVREWQRIDPETGALLSGRLEADRWINGPLNSYGKISDSQNISKPNGTQQTQRKQLEVLQSRTANGAMQVIRSQTVQTTSSRWSTTTTPPSPTTAPILANPMQLLASLTNGGDNSTNSLFQHSNHQHHIHYHKPHLTEFSTLPLASLSVSPPSPPLPPPSAIPPSESRWSQSLSGIEITEEDNDNDVDDDDVIVGGYIVDDSETQDYLINGSSSNSTINSYNSTTSNSNNTNNSNYKNTFYQRLNSNSSLVDTAPSLKLSNLMKSSSSISSNNSSSNSLTIASSGTTNSTTTTPTMNTHRTQTPASTISLHAIVGNSNNNNSHSHSNKTTASSIKNTTTTTTPTTTWQQQLRRRSSLFEQPDLFGNSNHSNSSNNSNVNLNSLYKSHVGVTNADDIKNTVNDFVHTNIVNVSNNDDEHRHKRQSIELTPTHLNRQMRRDLESFRHYNNNTASLSANVYTDERNHFNHHQYQQQQEHHHQQLQKQTSNNDDNDENDELRLSSRQQRRQQTPQSHDNSASLQRSRSISTDDLSTEWHTTDPTTGEETTNDWRRVSKLRRSFQLSNKNESNQNSTPKRPIDLPMGLGTVAKIRAELENKRRQLIAATSTTTTSATAGATKDDELTDNDEISEIRPKATKRSTFLTAETLRKIRGNLKQLSDESLYKDDLWALRKSVFEEKKTVAEQKQLSPERRLRQLTPEQSPEIIPPKSAFQVVAQRSVSSGENKTHSLESRQKYKDTNSAEWHFRRKSYGFEKMSPPEDRAMFRMDASTDSGLGRSGELANWSPTETMPSKRSTIIQFGDIAKAQRYQSPTDSEADEYNKRHSIAVDESNYMRKTSQVHLNGNGNTKIEQSLTATTSTTTTNSLFQRTQQQKRVEFCKTEVHFAAESGRVNIVETDGKPPPTNNFRRRRRITTGPLQSLVKAASATTPVKQFGDDELTKHKTILSTNVAYKATLTEGTVDVTPNVTIFTTKPQALQAYNQTEVGSRSSYASTSGIDTTDNENDEIAAIRGILKNKPIKPKPYHLGENIAKPTDLWSGLQLKSTAMPKLDDPLILAEHKKSVAERLRLAEQRQEHTMQLKSNGFSTKINVSLGETPRQPNDAGIPNKQIQRQASMQEMLLEDLREHQRILDEGLKSTSLIIKTMRSANEFDEAMRRLSIASIEAAAITPTIVVPMPMLRSNSYQETPRRYSTTSVNSSDDSTLYKSASYSSTTSLSSTIRRYSTDSNSSMPQTHTPNLQFSGNTVSQQLTQLRRMYDVQEDDSADEEVKSYFRGYHDNSDSGGGTQESSSLEDEQLIENTNSWSRLKAKRTVWKIEGIEEENKKSVLLPERAELPKSSNVMNIALHSPDAAATSSKVLTAAAATTIMPVAKPRTLTNMARSEQAQVQEQVQVQVAQTVRQSAVKSVGAPPPIKLPKDSLKIIKEARGARKLREHELSYFGVPLAKDDALYDESNASLPADRLTERNTIETGTQQQNNDQYNDKQTTTNWQSITQTNNRTHLMRHNATSHETHATKPPIDIRPAVRKSLQQRQRPNENGEDDDDEHFYENITKELKPTFKIRSTKPVNDCYDRKTDVQRDAMILSEMTRNADQTLKAISDGAALKDQRRRSLQRRNSKPLETIDEKIFAEKISDKCIAVNVSRGTFASEARRSSRHSTPSPNNLGRSSSQSSVECPRARSRSLSSEREYENAPIKPSRTSKTTTTTTTAAATASRQRQSAGITKSSVDSRSSSMDSQKSERSQRFSSDDELPRRIRSRRTLGSKSQQAHEKSTAEHTKHNKLDNRRIVGEKPSSATSTMRSTRTERNKCLHTEISKREQQQQQRTHHTATALTNHCHATRRPHRIEDDAPTHTIRSSDRSDKVRREKDSSSLTRSSRLVRSSRSSNDNHSSTHRSSNRSERSDREKEKLSRSSGHSSRSNKHSSHSERSTPATAAAASPITHHTTSTIRQRDHQRSTSHKSSDGSATKQADKQTSSKNAAEIQQQSQQQQHLHYHQHPMHVHKITTTAGTTTTAKQRERSSKNRK